MRSPEPTWSDPVHQATLRALLRAGAAPFLFGPDETHWILDAMRTLVVLCVADGVTTARLADVINERIRLFPRGGVDFIVIGGDPALRAVLEGVLSRTKHLPVGAVLIGPDGKFWAQKASGAVTKALDQAFANGIPSAGTPGELADELEVAQQSGRARIEALQSFARSQKSANPTATMMFLGAFALVFVMEWTFGHANMSTQVRMGACVAERVRHGQVWRLLAYAALHASLQHLAFNSFSLFSFGSFFERLLGTGRYLVLFVLAALGGGILSVLFTPNAVMVGASGALCGLLGAAVALALRPGTLLPKDVLQGFRRNMVVNVLLLAGVSALPGVSLAAHAGGFVVGFALMISGVLVPQSDETGVRFSWRIPGAVAAAVFVAAFGIAMARGTPWRASGGIWTRAVYPGTTLSADMPGPVHVVPRHDGVFEFVSGDEFDDRFTVRVVVTPSGQTFDTPQARIDAVNELRQQLVDRPSAKHAVGELQFTEVGGYPVLAQDSRGPNGSQFRNWYQVRRAAFISVQVISWPDASNAADDAPRRILASIRGDE